MVREESPAVVVISAEPLVVASEEPLGQVVADGEPPVAVWSAGPFDDDSGRLALEAWF